MFSPHVVGQDGAVPKQAELIRSTSGRAIGASGMAAGSVPLKKGVVYDVVREENGIVVLQVGSDQVMVPTGALVVSDKPKPPAAVAAGFVPGKIVLVSAKYSLDGNQPQNVKNALQKLIPQEVLTEPVRIIVSDGLSTAAQDQGKVSTGTVVSTGNAAVLTMRSPSRNVLTVKYMYNGQERTKQVPEGMVLVLP